MAHRERVWFECDEMYGETNKCDRKYTCNFQLQRHKEKGHITFKPKEKKKKEISSSSCTLCGIMIKEHPGALSNHKNKVHSNRPLIFCTHCTFVTKESGYMKSHESGQLGMIRCEL